MEVGECYAISSSYESYRNDLSEYELFNALECDPDYLSSSTTDIESCFRHSGYFYAKAVVQGLEKPVNSDYPLTYALYDNEDCHSSPLHQDIHVLTSEAVDEIFNPEPIDSSEDALYNECEDYEDANLSTYTWAHPEAIKDFWNIPINPLKNPS